MRVPHLPLRRHALALAAALAALGGCALAPPPARDEINQSAAANRQLPPQWASAASAPAGTAGAVTHHWLASFKDPQLEALAREALSYNADLQLAAARVEQAAAYQKLAGSTLYPQVNLLARGGGQMGGDASGLQGVGIFANWEIDLWGRVRSGAAAADRQYDSAALDAYYARQSLVAQVAKGWFLATEARLQKTLADDTVAASTRAASLAQERLRVGVGDEYDLRLAQANLQSLRDIALNLEQAYRQALRSLELLAGRYPAAVLAVPPELAPAPPPVPVGLPSELLERRPDVVAAERRVAAAFHRVQEAKAARLPRLSLTATFSSVTSELFVLQERDNPLASVGASLMVPLFLGGQLQAQVETRSAEQKQAMADYARVGSRAFGEVENALSAGFTLDAREPVLNQMVVENQRALELAHVRYKVGSGDLRGVLQQNLSLYAAQSALIRTRSERLVQRINLHLALGGSFEAPLQEQASSQAPAPATPQQ